MSKPDSCIFICSSDNTYDVFSALDHNRQKSLPYEDFDIFVGLNEKVATAPYKTVSSIPIGWRGELLNQIQSLPASFTRIILILDDFYFWRKISSNQFDESVSLANKLDADYLRLVPLESSFLVGWVRRVLRPGDDEAVRIKEYEPYYSSLQIAVWRRTHLERLLGLDGSIWDFEHHVISKSRHFAVQREIIHYQHVVEKGRWLPVALNEAVGIAKEGIQPRGLHNYKFYTSPKISKLKFKIFGYAVFRIRKILKSWLGR